MSCALWLAETISRHFFNQSHVTSKSVVTWSHASSRAYHQLHLLWVLIGSPKEGHPPLPLPGSTLGKSAFRNSAQRSDTTINYRTKKGKNKQNIAVLAWPKNTLFSSTVKYWTPLTTKISPLLSITHSVPIAYILPFPAVTPTPLRLEDIGTDGTHTFVNGSKRSTVSSRDASSLPPQM